MTLDFLLSGVVLRLLEALMLACKARRFGFKIYLTTATFDGWRMGDGGYWWSCVKRSSVERERCGETVLVLYILLKL
jgi:hypothetical protein